MELDHPPIGIRPSLAVRPQNNLVSTGINRAGSGRGFQSKGAVIVAVVGRTVAVGGRIPAGGKYGAAFVTRSGEFVLHAACDGSVAVRHEGAGEGHGLVGVVVSRKAECEMPAQS